MVENTGIPLPLLQHYLQVLAPAPNESAAAVAAAPAPAVAHGTAAALSAQLGTIGGGAAVPTQLLQLQAAAAAAAALPALHMPPQGPGGATPSPFQGATAETVQHISALVAQQLTGGAAGGLPLSAAPGALLPGFHAGGGGGVLPATSPWAHGQAPNAAQSAAMQAGGVVGVGDVQAGLAVHARALLQAQASAQQAQAQLQAQAMALADSAGLGPTVTALAGGGPGAARPPILLPAIGTAVGAGGVAPAMLASRDSSMAAQPLLFGVNAASSAGAGVNAAAGVTTPRDALLQELRARLALWRGRGRTGLHWAFFEDAGPQVPGKKMVSTVKCALCHSCGVYDVKKGWGGGPRRHVITKHADLLLALKVAEEYAGNVVDTPASLDVVPAPRMSAVGGEHVVGAGGVAAALSQKHSVLPGLSVGGANPTKAAIHATEGKVLSKRAEQYELLRTLAARLAHWHRSGRTQAHWALYDVDEAPPASEDGDADGEYNPPKRARRGEGAHQEQREGGEGDDREREEAASGRRGRDGQGNEGDRDGAPWARCAFCSAFAASAASGASRLAKHAKQKHPELLELVQQMMKVDLTANITDIGGLSKRLGVDAPADAPQGEPARRVSANDAVVPSDEDGGLGGGAGHARMDRSARPPKRRLLKSQLRRINIELMAQLLRRLSLWHAKKRVQTYWALFDLHEEKAQAPTVSTESGFPCVVKAGNWYMKVKCFLCEGERQGSYTIWRGGGVGGPLKHMTTYHADIHAALQSIVALAADCPSGGANAGTSAEGAKAAGQKRGVEGGGAQGGGESAGERGGATGAGSRSPHSPSSAAQDAASSAAVASAAAWSARRRAGVFNMSIPEINAELAPARARK